MFSFFLIYPGFILDTKPGREPKKYPGAMSQYVLPTCIDIKKEKRKCKSREKAERK